MVQTSHQSSYKGGKEIAKGRIPELPMALHNFNMMHGWLRIFIDQHNFWKRD